MIEFNESNFYKALQDFFINNDKETFLQFLAEFYNRTEGIIDKNKNQDEIIKELRELYVEFNEKGIDENIVREKVNYFLENSVKIKDVISKLTTNTNNIKNITSQLDNKAKEIDLDIERKRIDNIVKNEGTSVDDIELQDIRISANGKNYDSAGGSVRGQIGELYDILNRESITFLPGSYIDGNGNLVELDGYSVSDYILLNEGDTITVTAQGYNSAVSIIYVYNLDKSKKERIELGNDELKTYSFLATEKTYVRCSGKTNSIYGYVVKINNITKIINDNLNNTITRIDDIEYITINTPMEIDGYIDYNHGNFVTHTGYKCSDYINVSKYKGKEVNVTTYFDYSAGVAQYQKDKAFISGIGQGNYDNGDIQKIKIVGDYIRVTCKTSNINDFKMFFRINDLLKETEGEETINPCKYNGRSLTMFNKGICIGDSFTEGACNINASNEQFITDRFNYPKILSKLSNVEIINKGNSGITTKGWYEKYKNTDLSGYDFAIIYLGINDYFSNNKTLFSNEYRQIIDKLRNENKHIKIFCVTLTRHFRDFTNFNHYIREVANEKDCYLIDLEKYSDFSTNHVTGSHPNAYGYFTMANDIYSYISYIIDNNIDNFKNHQFSNTDYSY